MDKILTREGSTLLVRHSDHGRPGGICAVLGLIFSVACAPGPLLLQQPHLDGPGLWLGVILSVGCVMAIISGLIGLLLWYLQRANSSIDLDRRQVTLPGGQALPLDQLRALHLVLGDRHLQLLTRVKPDSQGRDTLAELREIALTEGDADPQAALVQSLLEDAARQSERLVDHRDGLAVWLTAAELARTLEVPLLESGRERLVWHTPADLRLSLQDRLARQLTPTPDLGPTPDGLTSLTTDQRLELRWDGPDRHSLALLVAGAVLATVAMFELYWGAMTVHSRVALWASAAVCLLVGTLLHRYSCHQLVVSDGTLAYLPRRGKTLTMATDQLELVYTTPALRPVVALSSRQLLIPCRMHDDSQAQWLVSAIRAFLARCATEANTPYR